MLVLTGILWPMTSVGQSVEPMLTGSVADLAAIRSLAAGCARRSATFDQAWKQAGVDRVPIEVTRSDGRVGLFGSFATGGRPHLIDLDHVERVPEVPDRGRRPLVRAANHPPWASSLCSVLVHEVAEADYAVHRSAAYDTSHAYAIGVENAVRRELGGDACRRRKDWRDDESRGVPHAGHTDAFIRLGGVGGHTERIHVLGPPTHFDIDYEVGSPGPCSGEDLSVSILWNPAP